MTVTVADPVVRVAAVRERFYVRMAAVCVAVGALGFAPTYWVPLAGGTLSVAPITHLHGLVFYAWLLFFLAQTSLVASGRVGYHRELGLAGIALATAMFFVGMGVSIHRIQELEAAGLGMAGRRFAVVPMTSITFFAIVFAIAVRYVRRPAVHKRLVLVATVALLQAPVARWIRLFLAPAAPEPSVGSLPPSPSVPFSTIPALLIDLLIVAAMIHDRRSTGRVHPAYWIAGGALLAVQLLRIPISRTDAWVALTHQLSALAP